MADPRVCDFRGFILTPSQARGRAPEKGKRFHETRQTRKPAKMGGALAPVVAFPEPASPQATQDHEYDEQGGEGFGKTVESFHCGCSCRAAVALTPQEVDFQSRMPSLARSPGPPQAPKSRIEPSCPVPNGCPIRCGFGLGTTSQPPLHARTLR